MHFYDLIEIWTGGAQRTFLNGKHKHLSEGESIWKCSFLFCIVLLCTFSWSVVKAQAAAVGQVCEYVNILFFLKVYVYISFKDFYLKFLFTYLFWLIYAEISRDYDWAFYHETLHLFLVGQCKLVHKITPKLPQNWAVLPFLVSLVGLRSAEHMWLHYARRTGVVVVALGV